LSDFTGGIGPLTEKLKAESSSPRIRFLGRLSESELLAYLYIADIFALPSITKNEAFGLVLVEAMYCFTPPVTFTIDGSGVNWVNVHNQTGLEVENMNVQKYAEAIDLLLAGDALRTLFSENARQRVCDHFILDKIIKSLKAIYDSLLYKQ
jgi:glycosyltransferase involved in cell wall biosynthesis